MPPAAPTTLDATQPLPPLRPEVLLLMPWAIAAGLLRESVAGVRAALGSLEPLLHETVMLFPRMVVAAEGIASVAPAIEELARTKPSIDRLAEATATLERLAEAGPTLEKLAASTEALDQLAATGITLQRIAETSGQLEKLANATVVAPIQGTAERFGRIVAGFPGGPRRAPARVADVAAPPAKEAAAKRRNGR